MTSTTSRRTAQTLDPDQLASLEQEREFLLRSLDDLDAEHAAGDLAETDHASLTDDYVRRLAEVSRAIEERRTAFAEVDNRLSSRQRWLTIIAVTVVAILAGLLLARASGFRAPNDATTGDIRRSSVGLLSEADALTREGRWEEAVEVYDEVLDRAPGNAEALTYRGWITAQLGDPDTGLIDLAEAVAVDPDFPDARVFSAILLDRQQRFGEAAEQIEVLDTLDVPDQMLGLIGSSNLRGSVAAGQINQAFDPLAGETLNLDDINAPLDDIASAGALLSQAGDPVRAQIVFATVLTEDPDQLVALVGRGQLGRQESIWELQPETAQESLAALDRALELLPGEQVIRLYRADVHLARGDKEAARADLLEIDIETLSPDLTGLYDEVSARLEAG